MNRNKTALVLGATGGIGGEVARQLLGAGWRVKALNRRAMPMAGHAADAASRHAESIDGTTANADHGDRRIESGDGLEWIQGDAMNRGDVVTAAQGASIIVHAVNPPGYRRWGELVLPMIDNTIAAAMATGARIVLPGSVYNHGPDAFPVLTEDSAQHPTTRKGAIRVEMENRLRAAQASGVRCLIVRAGDFFGPKAGNNWFAQGLVKPGRPVTRVTTPGRRGIGHQWAYLPDVARTMLELIEREHTLEPFAAFHLRGHWDADGTEFVEAIARVVS